MIGAEYCSLMNQRLSCGEREEELGTKETGGKVSRGVHSPHYKAWRWKNDGVGCNGLIRCWKLNCR